MWDNPKIDRRKPGLLNGWRRLWVDLSQPRQLALSLLCGLLIGALWSMTADSMALRRDRPTCERNCGASPLGSLSTHSAIGLPTSSVPSADSTRGMAQESTMGTKGNG